MYHFPISLYHSSCRTLSVAVLLLSSLALWAQDDSSRPFRWEYDPEARYLQESGIVDSIWEHEIVDVACDPLYNTLVRPTVRSFDFREYYQTGELNNYINYISDDMLWEGETTGQWTLPERMLFSIRGNSYEWNRFYLDGYRVDSRFLSGSMLYTPDMRETSITTDAERGAIHLSTDRLRRNQLWIEGNTGGLGGVSPLTKEMINVIHSTAQERAYSSLDLRSHMLWAGQASLTYGIPTHYGQTLYHRLYVNTGSRRIVRFDTSGQCGTYDAPFYKVQLNGDLPLGAKADNWSLHYIFDMQHRPDLYTEFGYGDQEVADYDAFSASVYTSYRPKASQRATFGLTYALHDQKHADQSFSRNVVDIDGEGFDPWNADGKLHEISLPATYSRSFALGDRTSLSLDYDGYNSLLHFSPRTDAWSNQVYCQFEGKEREDWYRYDFSSSSFTGAMFENTLGVNLRYDANYWFTLTANAALTYDAIILRDKYVGLPSWEAELALHMQPTEWFNCDIVLGHYRTKYTWNQLRLLSSDYQNGALVGPHAPYSNYGGAYLTTDRRLQQPQYTVLDMPFRFVVAGRHEFACFLTARLYTHMWQIADNPDYGTLSDASQYIMTEQQPVTGAGMFALPLYLSNTLRYTYNGRKVFFSLSWQSYQMSGLTTLGNGAENNSIGSLTYSMLNPSNQANLDYATESSVQTLARLDQDKAYICRIQLGANINENWQLMLNAHWQDGTPITNYRVQDGNVYPADTKGINPSDMNFGKRKDMFFNVDLKLGYRGNINMRDQRYDAHGAIPFSVDLTCYNIYDFGTEWYEYSFDQYLEHTRRAVSICIPRGLLLRLSIGLSKNK